MASRVCQSWTQRSVDALYALVDEEVKQQNLPRKGCGRAGVFNLPAVWLQPGPRDQLLQRRSSIGKLSWLDCDFTEHRNISRVLVTESDRTSETRDCWRESDPMTMGRGNHYGRGGKSAAGTIPASRCHASFLRPPWVCRTEAPVIWGKGGCLWGIRECCREFERHFFCWMALHADRC